MTAWWSGWWTLTLIWPKCRRFFLASGHFLPWVFGFVGWLRDWFRCFRNETMIHCHPRTTISAIGRASVQRDCVVPRNVRQAHTTEVAVMERFGLVFKHSAQGHVCLASTTTMSITSLSAPIPVKKKPYTAYEGRANLVSVGWTTVESAYDCSVEGRRMMQFQCAGYYSLLDERYDQVLALTGENSFSHSQKHGYYSAVRAVCSVTPFVPW